MSASAENGTAGKDENQSIDVVIKDGDKKDDPSFEKVLEMLGVTGRFQTIQLSMIFLSKFIVTFMALSYVFVGYSPPHVCNAVNNTSLLMTHDRDLLNYSDPKVRYDDECTISVTASAIMNEPNFTENGNKDPDSDDVTVFSTDCSKGRNFYTTNGKPTTYISEWDLVCESTGIAEWSQTLFIAGQILGGLIVSPITDRSGRKPVFVFCTGFVFVLEALVLVAPNIYVIYVIKLFSGLCFQGIITSYYVSGVEILIPRQRQVFGVAICFLWVFQLLLMGAVAYLLQYQNWRYLQGIIAASGVPCLLFPFFFNESARWLATNNKREQALDIIKLACKRNKKDFARVKVVFDNFMSAQNKDLNKSENMSLILSTRTENDSSLSDKDEEQTCYAAETKMEIVSLPAIHRTEKQSILTLFQTRSLIFVTLIVLYTWLTCNMTYYGLFITSSSIAGDRFLNFILMAVVEIPSNVIILVVLERLSRRFVLMFFLSLSGVSLMASSIFVSAVDENSAISAALFIFGKFSITCAFNTIFIYTPEVFPTNLRGVGTGFCNSFSRCGSMIAPFLRPLYSVAPWAPGLMFTVMCAINTCLIPFLPEMKDKNLPNNVGDVEKRRREGP